MEIHKSVLKLMCRLCGETSRERNLTDKHKFKREILSSLGIDLALDNISIHPPFVCDCCRLKIHRWRQQKVKKPVKIELFVDFREHGNDCRVCQDQQWDGDLILNFCRSSGLHCWRNRNGSVIAIQTDDDGYIVTKRLEVCPSREIKVQVLGHTLQHHEVTVEGAVLFMQTREICIGNPTFPSIAAENVEHGLVSKEGQKVADVDRHYLLNGTLVNELTIRHTKCELLVKDKEQRKTGHQCKVCYQYKCSLAAAASQKASKQDIPSKFTPNVHLSNEQLLLKTASLAKEKIKLQVQNKSMKEKLSSLLKNEGVVVNDGDSQKLGSILENCTDVDSLFPNGSYARLLWEQQLEAKKKHKQMRWHPDVIRWAIAIQSKSSSAYKLLRDSGFMVLPHPNTLYTYTHAVQPGSGINPDLLQRLYNDFDMANLKDHETFINLIFDEMKIKSGLCFSRGTGKLVGFVDVHSLSEEMRDFESRCTKDDSGPIRLASHVLLFMGRGLTSKMKFPLAYFGTENVGGNELYPMVMTCIKALKYLGLNVMSVTSDGASCNRKMYMLLAGLSDSSQAVHKGENPYSRDNLFFICDPPHLIKTARNNLENSNWNRKSRNLVFRGKAIAWTHLLLLQEWDQGPQRKTPGLQLVPKLSYDHLHLTPGLRMKVNLAAQVLSATVANALEAMNRPELSSTIHFIRMMNKFFDCLNVCRRSDWQRTKNENLKPYTSTDDPRFKWLQEEFLQFLREWESETDGLDLSKAEKNKLCLSQATLNGLRITAKSVCEMVPIILKREGVSYFLTGKLNQDLVEEFFAKQRGAGGSFDNPTLEQFGHLMMTNYVAGSSSVASVRANVQVRESPVKSGERPLPKKRRTGKTLWE